MRKVKIEKLTVKNAEMFAFGKVYRNAGFKRFSIFTISFSILLFAFCLNGFAQETAALDNNEAPPPLKIVPRQEKSLLKAETNVSDRTKLSLELMESHLKKAEDFRSREMFAEMFGELGGFNALIDDTLDFLNRNDDGRGKVLNNFKRLEINLRRFTPRLELIRRELPGRYELYVRRLIKNVRMARSKAVEPLFDDSVVPNDTGQN